MDEIIGESKHPHLASSDAHRSRASSSVPLEPRPGACQHPGLDDLADKTPVKMECSIPRHALGRKSVNSSGE